VNYLLLRKDIRAAFKQNYCTLYSTHDHEAAPLISLFLIEAEMMQPQAKPWYTNSRNWLRMS